MYRPIQLLPAQLANQIAAGEVVERPASVVKELLENSIDAGADQIELTVEQGGLRLIRVLDNGEGIPRDELRLAISPHATSKIYNQDELERIASLGFRGEALASIASVSRFRLSSHAVGQEQGWEIGSDAGEPVPCALPAGTQVEVRDLFHSIPARRKFLRSERTEFLHLEEVVKRLVLSRFDVAFTLLHNGRQVMRLRAANDAAQQVQRVGEVMGRGFLNSALQLHFEAAGMRLHGWLSSPEGSHSHADGQYFYLNGRMIRDRLINHAIRQAHQGVLEPGRHPVYVLFLEVDPGQVDVNVHPTKHEVRFREPRMVHDFIHRALRDGLAGGAVEVQPAHVTTEWVERRSATSGAVAEQHAFYRQAVNAVVGTDSACSLGEARAILHQRFLLAGSTERPLLLDMDRARRHLLQCHLEQALLEGEVRSQPLLIPQIAQLPEADVDLLVSVAERMAPLGIELGRLGEGTVVLRRIPSLLHGVDANRVLQLILERAREPGGGPAAESPQLLADLASLAVAATPVYDLAAASRLLGQLDSLPDKGEPFWRLLSCDDLQRWVTGDEREV